MSGKATLDADVIAWDDRDDWLQKRREGIGASDVSGILGLSPYATPFTVWADKVHGQSRPPTFAMDLGRKLEGIIIEAFEDATALHVSMRQILFKSRQHPWARATVDGVAFESPETVGVDALGLVECKSDGSSGRWDDDIPLHHLIQVQWQMLVTRVPFAWLAVLHGGRSFELYEVPADEDAQRSIFGKVDKFRRDHIETGEPPDPDGHDATAAAVRDLYGSADPDKTIELSKDMAADVEALRGVKARQAELKAERQRLENRIKVSMQEADTGTVGGRVVVTWREQERREVVQPATKFRVLRTPTPKGDKK